MFKIRKSSRFLNREISWLQFNNRVIDEASNKTLPLLERVKLLSISMTNLDEFGMLRLGEYNNPDIIKMLRNINAKQYACLAHLIKPLYKQGIKIASYLELPRNEKKIAHALFVSTILPKLKVIPIVENKKIYIPSLHNIVIFNTKVGNVLVYLAKPHKQMIAINNYFVHVQELISVFGKLILPEHKIRSMAYLQIMKNAEVYLEYDDFDENSSGLLTKYIEKLLQKRKTAEIIQLKVGSKFNYSLLRWCMSWLTLKRAQVMMIDENLIIRDLAELYNLPRPDLKFQPYQPTMPKILQSYHNNYHSLLTERDLIIHHPYDSFEVVTEFIKQAAADPYVTEIKHSVYRTTTESPIVKALIEAAKANKKVTVVIELRARFDEKSNLNLANIMESNGIKVFYGSTKYKTHAKLSLITRRKLNKVANYAHFSTGNYHPLKAQIYSDISYFTSDKELCNDADKFFQFIGEEHSYKQKAFNKLILSPFDLRDKLLELIDNEIEFAKSGAGGVIWIKCNALTDPIIINKLYKASQAGVKILMIIRGICCLRPGVRNLSENIMVKSIVGRFLEHTRVYCFGNNGDSKVFISSADLMERNLDKRVEIMVPIEKKYIKQEILHDIMLANIKDNIQSWYLSNNGTYHRIKNGIFRKKPLFSAHNYFLNFRK